jgi:hypothetical protein
MRSLTLLSALVTTLVVAVPAFAQEEGSEGGETAPKPKPAPKPVAYAAPAAAPAAAVVDTKSDHEAVVGRLGVGYLGSMQTPLGAAANSLTAQIVGIRYWAQSAIAITGGLGFGTASSSRSDNGTTTDGPAATTFALKGGVAIALASGKHFTFVLEPQAVFGYASQTITLPAPGGTIEHTGNRFMLGSTVGGEIQFGFMGIPELSLVGSVGLAFDTQSGKTKETRPGSNEEHAESKTGVGTFTLANPWNIFAGNIAAIYYL